MHTSSADQEDEDADNNMKEIKDGGHWQKKHIAESNDLDEMVMGYGWPAKN